MIFLSIFISLVILLLIMTIFKYRVKTQELMKKLKESEKSYQGILEQYTANNRNLETRILEEVEKNRQKDHFLIKHTRLASMGEMITSISHQWGQPLNSLSLIIQDVREEFEYGVIDDQYIDKFTKESMSQIKELSRTIHDFRQFYQPNKEKSLFSIGNSIEDALFIFSSSINYYGINIEFEYGGQPTAYGYPNEFSQVVLNILTNAREAFDQKNKSNRKIVIKLGETDEFASAKFIDNAGGIEPELLNKVFNPYFTTRLNGTGLGLYMTKMMLENMNGHVSVENTGDGACVSLFVPKDSDTMKTETVIK